MDPTVDFPRRRRRRDRISFRRRQVPVRLIIPNLFTIIGLCAGLTAIRMAIETRYEMALALIVAAALLDGIDGRVARFLKAQSKFGAELDSLADFVNFGVAPAIVVYTWGFNAAVLGVWRPLAWIVVMLFAVACGLRLARFNAALDEEKPRWQSNYFTGMPAPAGAITVLLPVYLFYIGLPEIVSWPPLILVYTIAMAFMMVSTIPTFSGKLAGERIGRDYVPHVLVLAALAVAMLLTYPYPTLALVTVAYLGLVPFSVRRYAANKARDAGEAEGRSAAVAASGLPEHPGAAAGPGQPRLDRQRPDADETRH